MSAGADRLGDHPVRGPGVHLEHEPEGRRPGLGVAGQHGVLHRGRAAPARQDREVQVHEAVPRDVEHPLRQQRAVRDHRAAVGRDLGQPGDEVLVARALRLEDLELQLLRPQGDRARGQPLAAPARRVGARDDRDHLVVGGDERVESRHGDLRGPAEDDSHPRTVRVFCPRSARTRIRSHLLARATSCSDPLPSSLRHDDGRTLSSSARSSRQRRRIAAAVTVPSARSAACAATRVSAQDERVDADPDGAVALAGAADAGDLLGRADERVARADGGAQGQAEQRLAVAAGQLLARRAAGRVRASRCRAARGRGRRTPAAPARRRRSSRPWPRAGSARRRGRRARGRRTRPGRRAPAPAAPGRCCPPRPAPNRRPHRRGPAPRPRTSAAAPPPTPAGRAGAAAARCRAGSRRRSRPPPAARPPGVVTTIAPVAGTPSSRASPFDCSTTHPGEGPAQLGRRPRGADDRRAHVPAAADRALPVDLRPAAPAAGQRRRRADPERPSPAWSVPGRSGSARARGSPGRPARAGRRPAAPAPARARRAARSGPARRPRAAAGRRGPPGRGPGRGRRRRSPAPAAPRAARATRSWAIGRSQPRST